MTAVYVRCQRRVGALSVGPGTVVCMGTYKGRLMDTTAGAADTRGAATAASGAGDRGAVAAFLRFVVCGGGVSVAASAVLLALTGRLPFAVANAAVTLVSTLLATELHHRFTFGSSGAGFAGWRIHAKSAATLLGAYLFTTAAVLGLGGLDSHASPLLTQAVYLAASGVAGTGRFLVLRLMVFAHRPAAGTRPPRAPRLHRGEIAVAA